MIIFVHFSTAMSSCATVMYPPSLIASINTASLARIHLQDEKPRNRPTRTNHLHLPIFPHKQVLHEQAVKKIIGFLGFEVEEVDGGGALLLMLQGGPLLLEKSRYWRSVGQMLQICRRDAVKGRTLSKNCER